MGDARIDRQALQERASSAFELLREKLVQALRSKPEDVVKCVHESTGEVEETVASIIQINPNLLVPFQNMEAAGYDAVEFVPPKTLYRLVDRFPEDVFDGKALSTPYLSINLQDSNRMLCLTHWFKRSCRKAFSSPGFCFAESQAACTLSMPMVSPREGFAFFHTLGSVQSSSIPAPKMTG